MKTVELKKYFDKSSQKVVMYLSDSGGKHPVKTLHELRVEIKRIRFVCHLIQHFNKKSDVDLIYKPYEKVFKNAGKIRSIQMQRKLITMLEESDVFDKIIKEHKRNEKKLLRKFFKKAEIQSEILNAYKPLINGEIEKIINPDLESYADHLLKFLFHNLTTKTKPEELHELRKKVKELIFMGRFSKALNEFISTRLNIEIADNLQEKIGDWHDKLELLNILSDKNIKVKKSELILFQIAITKIKTAMNNDINEIKLLVSGFHQSIRMQAQNS
jgi:CHAD domain-containing protein